MGEQLKINVLLFFFQGSNALVGKSIELALNISTAVVDKLTPLAEKGINVASPITTKVDEIAAKSLDRLVARVPVINEEPKEASTLCPKILPPSTKYAPFKRRFK